MIPLDTTYACPTCHLRFPQLAELRGHIDDEHRRLFDEDPVEAPTAPVGRITVPMDPDRPPPVSLAVARQVARQLGCALDLVAAPGLGLQEGAEAFLHARARQLRLDGAAPVTTEVLHSDRPAGAVLDHAAAATADLLCLSTRAAHGPTHLMFGSVAEAILLGAEVPVLLAGPHVAAPPGPYTTVVACVDGSTHAAVALQVAQRLRALISGELRLVEVVDPEVQVPPDAFEGAELMRLARSLDPEPADYEVLHGKHPDAAIVEYVNRLQDAIVVTGTHGRTGLRSLLMGSVARGVVAESVHPTLVVPPRTDAEAFLRLTQPPTTEQGAPR